MELGIIGLGKMGANMAIRLLRGDHRVVAFDRSEEARRHVAAEGAAEASSLSDLVEALPAPRVLWLMLPAGEVTETVAREALEALEPGDVLVDGANSNWRDSMRRSALCAERNVHFVDCGVSGGVWGLEEGYNLMVGAEPEAFERLRPALDTLAAHNGHLHVGPPGAGHFVKMIHNGIEYGMMQAYGEGFAALADFPHHQLDLPAITRLWLQGSVVRSWLLELAALALEKDPRLEDIHGYVEDSGMGRWTVEYGIERAVAMPAISAALYSRFKSRQPDGFAERLAAALRKEFGGHAVRQKDV